MKFRAARLARLRLVLILFLYSPLFLYSQSEKTVAVSFRPVFNGVPLQIGNTYYLKNGDSIQFENLKFYISQIEFLDGNKTTWREQNSFHLADASDEKTMDILLHTPAGITFNKIKFGLGIDSVTNSSGAMGGDLDPTKGMYWTWQSGYINFKVEGTSNLCKSPNKEFRIHAGGYQLPFNCFRTVTLNVGREKGLGILMELSEFMNDVNLSAEDHVMSPGERALALSKKLSECFHVGAK